MTKTTLLDGKEIPLSNKATLQDAIYWIAARIPPVRGDYYPFTKKYRNKVSPELLEEAREELLYKLKRGEIHAKGCPCSILEDPELGPRVSNVEDETDIPANTWIPKFIAWETSEIKTRFSSDSFCRIYIKDSDLLKFYPRTSDPIKSNKKKFIYRSPYMEFMDQAIRELKITESSIVKKTVIMDWLKDNAPRDLKLSPVQIKYMATFLRTPAHTIGGLKSVK